MHCTEEKRLKRVPAESIAALNARATLQCDSSPLPSELRPEEIRQGNIGDCWLLSAIAALGAHDPRAIRHLFRDEGSCCTVRLFDLHDWSPRDVSNVGASAPSDSLTPIVCAAPRWVALLEQAVAIHCGGYAMLNGGQPPRAWAILTGYKPQYTIKLDPATKRYQIGGWLNPNQSGSWEAPGNSAHSTGFRGLWPMEWPEVGGGGQRGTTIDRSELLRRKPSPAPQEQSHHHSHSGAHPLPTPTSPPHPTLAHDASRPSPAAPPSRPPPRPASAPARPTAASAGISTASASLGKVGERGGCTSSTLL